MIKIEKEFYDQTVNLRSQLAKQEKLIIDRINYIVNCLDKSFPNKSYVKKANWFFVNAEEGELGDFWNNHGLEFIDIIFLNFPNKMIIIDKKGIEYDFAIGSLPTRWLFEDFEEELIEGTKKYKELEKKKEEYEKQKKIIEKKENFDLLKSAKEKLTKEEFSALMNLNNKR